MAAIFMCAPRPGRSGRPRSSPWRSAQVESIGAPTGERLGEVDRIRPSDRLQVRVRSAPDDFGPHGGPRQSRGPEGGLPACGQGSRDGHRPPGSGAGCEGRGRRTRNVLKRSRQRPAKHLPHMVYSVYWSAIRRSFHKRLKMLFNIVLKIIGDTGRRHSRSGGGDHEQRDPGRDGTEGRDGRI